MAKRKQIFIFIFFILLTVSCEHSALRDKVRVGVILDLNSMVGRIAERWISKAHSDFYAANSHYRTRLVLLTRNSTSDVVVAASEALDLMKNEEVHAIKGPQSSAEAKFIIKLGQKAEVPIISFSATSPGLSPTKSPFFIRTAHDDCFQVRAIADIVKAYGWREVIPIYEDTDYGNGLIPCLNDAFQEYSIRVPYRSVISPNSTDSEILNELKKLKQNRTTIFVVHMIASIGSKLFTQANKAGMMSEGYAWIVTEGLSTLLDPIDPKVMDHSMQGVLGLRPYIPKSINIKNLKAISKGSINLFGLWAYDSVWAVAMAVEKAGIANSRFSKPNTSKTRVDLASLGKSGTGHNLLRTLLTTKFEGLSGNFHLLNGQLEPSAFEIFNVIGETERIIGYWTKEKGLLRNLKNNHKAMTSASLNEVLKKPIWPGNTVESPRKLRIGVPVREGFKEFVKVDYQKKTIFRVLHKSVQGSARSFGISPPI